MIGIPKEVTASLANFDVMREDIAEIRKLLARLVQLEEAASPYVSRVKTRR